MKTVFFDVDTQNDFLFPGGALYVPGAEKIVPTIAALNHYAAAHHIPVVSTMDAHTPNDPEFKDWPPHCVAGSEGQQKPSSSLLEKIIVVSTDATQAPHESLAKSAQQILLEKQTFNCFSNTNLPGILEHLGAGRYVVYGVVTEICVKYAVEGLLQTGARVELVTDAVRELNDAAAREVQASFTAAGGILTDARTILAT